MDTDDVFTVSQLAALSGTTVRTLHHYDEIGLLRPSQRTEAGYRLYDADDLQRLQIVLTYRACGMTLPDIAAALAAEGTTLTEHLQRQLQLLDERSAELESQRALLTRALEESQMGITLDPQEYAEVFGDRDPRQYADEVQERWGDTDAYRESHRRTSAYNKADWQRLGEESEAIEAEFAACLTTGEPSDGDRAKALAERHRRHIDQWFYPCSYDMQVALADMYVSDPRFAAHYDERVPGLSAYVRDAILANALDHVE